MISSLGPAPGPNNPAELGIKVLNCRITVLNRNLYLNRLLSCLLRDREPVLTATHLVQGNNSAMTIQEEVQLLPDLVPYNAIKYPSSADGHKVQKQAKGAIF